MRGHGPRIRIISRERKIFHPECTVTDHTFGFLFHNQIQNLILHPNYLHDFFSFDPFRYILMSFCQYLDFIFSKSCSDLNLCSDFSIYLYRQCN